eukprot:5707208-Prymnesium_polylepis.1
MRCMAQHAGQGKIMMMSVNAVLCALRAGTVADGDQYRSYVRSGSEHTEVYVRLCRSGVDTARCSRTPETPSSTSSVALRAAGPEGPKSVVSSGT